MIVHYTLTDIAKIVRTQLIPAMRTSTVFTLTGPLGAGKTTLMHEWLSACGVTEQVISPTFTYVQTYKNAKNETFYHFDLYRLSSANEFVAMGFDEYLTMPNSYSFIEWPGVIAPLLSTPGVREKVCMLTIGYVERDFGQRVLEIESPKDTYPSGF